MCVLSVFTGSTHLATLQHETDRTQCAVSVFACVCWALSPDLLTLPHLNMKCTQTELNVWLVSLCLCLESFPRIFSLYHTSTLYRLNTICSWWLCVCVCVCWELSPDLLTSPRYANPMTNEFWLRCCLLSVFFFKGYFLCFSTSLFSNSIFFFPGLFFSLSESLPVCSDVYWKYVIASLLSLLCDSRKTLIPSVQHSVVFSTSYCKISSTFL